MPNFDKMIEDLVEGAKRAGAKVEIKPACGHEEKLAAAGAMLQAAHGAGVKAATDRYKLAFLPALLGLGARVAGPALARAGMSRLAPMAAQAGMGRVAPMLARGAQAMSGSGMGAQMAQMGASEAAGQGMDRLMGGPR